MRLIFVKFYEFLLIKNLPFQLRLSSVVLGKLKMGAGFPTVAAYTIGCHITNKSIKYNFSIIIPIPIPNSQFPIIETI